MKNSSISLNTYNLIRKRMNASVLQQKVIAHNIANINTKGYKKFDVVFDEMLNDNKDISMKVTDKKHFSSSGFDDDVRVVRDESSSMRKDGNNVDIDNEMVKLASNTLMYNALVSEIRNRFSMRDFVIKGGR
ncbi:flagellar basal body rod protein FlgB [Clostridium tepidiprofundi DSM 19306]|uniref:Flagellar basal body rod protein FlgB n=1 Tax=Clostridium tepidiprofundi DSM 19306 TaxID=1121338 RepID=A0A151B5K7_9CLOT|nr:flagellar basal body rod protein FlgB [Clostridium tepidiprofundi]KYH35083.1 flagellar basal body rod protein FlgB [Clostridium tepidiprofundi DSM 19306]